MEKTCAIIRWNIHFRSDRIWVYNYLQSKFELVTCLKHVQLSRRNVITNTIFITVLQDTL